MQFEVRNTGDNACDAPADAAVSAVAQALVNYLNGQVQFCCLFPRDFVPGGR